MKYKVFEVQGMWNTNIISGGEAMRTAQKIMNKNIALRVRTRFATPQARNCLVVYKFFIFC